MLPGIPSSSYYFEEIIVSVVNMVSGDCHGYSATISKKKCRRKLPGKYVGEYYFKMCDFVSAPFV